jgi:transposase
MLSNVAPHVRTSERRKAAMQLIATGLNQAEVARVLSVSRESVRKWVDKYQAGGERALEASEAHRGRYFALTDGQAKALMAEARRQGLQTLTEVCSLARASGIDASRSAIRRKLIALALWPT